MARKESRDQKRKRKKAKKAKARKSSTPQQGEQLRYWVPHVKATGDMLHLVDDDGCFVCYAYSKQEKADALAAATSLDIDFEVVDGGTFLSAVLVAMPLNGVDIVVLDDEIYLPVTFKGVATVQKTDEDWGDIETDEVLRLRVTRALTYYLSGVHIPLGLPDDPVAVEAMDLGSTIIEENRLQGKKATTFKHDPEQVQAALNQGATVLVNKLGNRPIVGENFIVKVQWPLKYAPKGVPPLRIYDEKRRVDLYCANPVVMEKVHHLFEGEKKGYVHCIRGEGTTFFLDLNQLVEEPQEW